MMRFGRKVLIGLLMVGLVACDGGDGVDGRQSNASEVTRIAGVIPTNANPYWQDMSAGMRSSGRRLGRAVDVDIYTGGEDTDVERQIQVIRNLTKRGRIDALVVGPASSSEIVPAVAEFRREVGPVVVVDSRLDSVAMSREDLAIDAFRGSQNRKGGQLAASRILDLIGSGEQRVLLVRGSPQHSTAIARERGFRDAAPSQWERIERRGDWNRTKANRIMRAVLDEGAVAGVFAASDEMALGVVAALESEGLPQRQWPVIVGFDATHEGLTAIDEGKMCASIRQQPFEIGREGVRTAVQLLEARGEVVARKRIEVEVVPGTIGPCVTRNVAGDEQ